MNKRLWLQGVVLLATAVGLVVLFCLTLYQATFVSSGQGFSPEWHLAVFFSLWLVVAGAALVEIVGPLARRGA